MFKNKRIIYGIIFLAILLIELLIALFIRDKFIRPYMGDMLVAVLICCLGRLLFLNKIPVLPIYVFLFTLVVEIIQYFDLVQLLGLESNRFISTLVGRTFSLADIICYAAGCLLFSATEMIAQRCKTKSV